MIEQTIRCPKCNTEIPLTQSLAAPLIEAVRTEYEARIAETNAAIVKRESHVREQQVALDKARESINEEVAKKLHADRLAIAAEEAKKARTAIADEIAKEKQERAATEELLKDRDEKLAASQKCELELRLERQRLQEEKERFELDKQRAIDAERAKIRQVAIQEADEQARLKLAGKEKTITDLQVKLQDALRKAEQGSQQLQGEVQELDLEAMLKALFPQDSIEEISKGERGADVMQRIVDGSGQRGGSLLWESKRTKNWSDAWIAKIKQDQRAAQADVAVIVTQAMPNEIATFGMLDGVWVTTLELAGPLASALRVGLAEIAAARRASDGQQTKMEILYRYLTGLHFKQRVEAMMDGYRMLKDDLESEKRAMIKRWAARDKQLEIVMLAISGMWGDLQGIAGKTLPEIAGFELNLLESPGEH